MYECFYKGKSECGCKYVKNNYDDIKVRTAKGKRQLIHERAEKRGESVNAFINIAIEETIQREKTYKTVGYTDID